MLLRRARRDVVETCRALRREGLVVGTAGNVSVRDGDLLAVSPSGLDYDELTPELVGVHALDGSRVEGRLEPTSELALHLAVHAGAGPPAGDGPGVRAVVHTHAVASTALATLDLPGELPAVHYYTALFGGPLRVAPYARFGTPELAAHAAAALAGRSAALLANHGAVVLGGSARQALERARYLEYVCDVHLRALATGRPLRVLADDELAAAGRRLAGYGQAPRDGAAAGPGT